MKFYTRQLNSLEELRREKHMLRYAKKHTDDWLSFKDMEKGDTGAREAAGAGILGTVISALGSGSLFSSVLAIAPPILTLMSRNTNPQKKKKNPLEVLARDVIFGYLKWKAIHFAYKGARSLFGDKKHKQPDHR